jgi:hypothetical protein
MCFLWSTDWVFISQKTTFFIVTAIKPQILRRFIMLLKYPANSIWVTCIQCTIHCRLSKIDYNFMLFPSMPKSSKLYLSLSVTNWNYVCISYLHHECCNFNEWVAKSLPIKQCCSSIILNGEGLLPWFESSQRYKSIHNPLNASMALYQRSQFDILLRNALYRLTGAVSRWPVIIRPLHIPESRYGSLIALGVGGIKCIMPQLSSYSTEISFLAAPYIKATLCFLLLLTSCSFALFINRTLQTDRQF